MCSSLLFQVHLSYSYSYLMYCIAFTLCLFFVILYPFPFIPLYHILIPHCPFHFFAFLVKSCIPTSLIIYYYSILIYVTRLTTPLKFSIP
jgi:hypothetical protein